MSDRVIDNIVECMAISNGDPTIQRVQTEHRLKLAQYWDIKEGSRILEIGCGQGDTTAVLAYLTGENGFVHGIDRASPDYGRPITLAYAAEHLKKSKLGKQIKIDFDVDLLSSKVDFPENAFDVIVLSHCSWYFKSFDEFSGALKKLRRWGKRLCFAEWDARMKTIEQLPHFLAILLQAQYECFKENSQSNIRTLFTPNDIKILAENTGWNIISDKSFVSVEMQDGKWEIENTLTEYQFELDKINRLPAKFKSLIQSEVNLLEESLESHAAQPLSIYAMIAE